MKRKTRDNILHYVVATVAVTVFLLTALLFGIGLSWLCDKIGWPMHIVVFIASFIYLVWYVKRLTS